jgi:hypothetical protein
MTQISVIYPGAFLQGRKKSIIGFLLHLKTKSVISGFLPETADRSPKSVRDFGSTGRIKRCFSFPHGSIACISATDPGASPRRSSFHKSFIWAPPMGRFDDFLRSHQN